MAEDNMDKALRLTAFSLSCFITLAGFLQSSIMYLYWGLWLQKDMPGGIQAITLANIGQTIAGAVTAIWTKPTATS